MSLEIVSIVTAGAIASTISSLVYELITKKNKKKETLEDKINKLTSALKESSHIITSVESEIQSRQKLVSELQDDAQRYEKLISMNQEQVDAVAQVFQGELQKESKKSFWKGVAVNFIFFIMGAIVSWSLSSNL